ncbi:hypothetical protein PULV_a4174 [Pseudoalteromonas ulvae UL12]|nr:hypothetical protein [Pseudoalteromonas ulvae UL12]
MLLKIKNLRITSAPKTGSAPKSRPKSIKNAVHPLNIAYYDAPNKKDCHVKNIY